MTKVKERKVGTERMGDLPQLQSVGGVCEVRGRRIGGSRTHRDRSRREIKWSNNHQQNQER